MNTLNVLVTVTSHTFNFNVWLLIQQWCKIGVNYTDGRLNQNLEKQDLVTPYYIEMNDMTESNDNNNQTSDTNCLRSWRKLQLVINNNNEERSNVDVKANRKDEEALEEEDGNITAVYWPRLPAISPGWKAGRLSSILLPCRRSERLDGRVCPVDGSGESVDDSPEEGNLLTEGEPPQRAGTTGCLIYFRWAPGSLCHDLNLNVTAFFRCLHKAIGS